MTRPPLDSTTNDSVLNRSSAACTSGFARVEDGIAARLLVAARGESEERQRDRCRAPCAVSRRARPARGSRGAKGGVGGMAAERRKARRQCSLCSRFRARGGRPPRQHRCRADRARCCYRGGLRPIGRQTSTAGRPCRPDTPWPTPPKSPTWRCSAISRTSRSACRTPSTTSSTSARCWSGCCSRAASS